jgi:indole-3-glycerol phosphate synthase
MILDEIVQVKKVELRKAKQVRKIAELKAKARNVGPTRGFDLRQRDAVSIIAEVKRASPAKGVLKADLDPADQALRYKAGGARAISVLTDEQFFRGSVDDLRAARDAADLPILRKDFVIDEYQLWEARVLRADAALLIVRILDRAQLRDYIALAREELKIATLVEVHSEKELDLALDSKAAIIGINNRDLDTFKVTIETTARLRELIPAGTVVVSESGLSRREDIVLLKSMKVDAALIGEELVKAADPEAKIKELLGA